MIGILHGYLLDGSGSNLWTRSVVRSLCEQGRTVHLFCQEPHPEVHDFIAEAHRHGADGASETFLTRDVAYPGRCIMHKPQRGETLPVYVEDEYEEFTRVVPMADLPDEDIADYLERNRAVVARVVAREGLAALHANHAVLQSVVAMEVEEEVGVPYAVMPHGSALEYAVKRDLRMHAFAAEAVDRAGRIIVIGDEMRRRVETLFPELPRLGEKMLDLNLGVDTRLFEPLPRARRGEAIERLVAGLAGVPRGGNKEPDRDLEAKLARVEWADDQVLLFVGRLIAAKGPQSVLAAFPRVLERHPDARLILVGHGPLRPVLEDMVAALDAGDVEA
ncbi:MAG TPA: glycosyltransferase, partial [Longimicrobiales bacterium]|nr:glycosyltransferase [Longimicrobiales bacterium]